MRCFVALDLPSDVRAAVESAQDRLRAASPRADVRWTAPQAIHLTLRFLGEVAEADIPAVRAALAALGLRHAPIALVAAGLGAFPGPARPRVLWAGITGGIRELGLLAADLERTVAGLGFPPEPRPFRGHLTLGRVRSPRGVAKIGRLLATDDGAAHGAWTARELTLYRSHLHPTGAQYEPLARLPLGGGAPA